MTDITMYDLTDNESIRYESMTIIRVTDGFNYIYFDQRSGVATSSMFISDNLVYGTNIES